MTGTHLIFLISFFVLIYFFLDSLISSIYKIWWKKDSYFISYVTQKNHQPALFQNCVVKTHPIEWQLTQNENSTGMRYRIISWKIVNSKQSKLFEKEKQRKSY